MDCQLDSIESVQVKAQNLLNDIRSRKTRKIYIAGPMSGLPDYNRPNFHVMATRLEQAGYTVLNPAILPDGLSQAEYMDICGAMIRCVDALVMLPGWKRSEGAVAEYTWAKKLSRDIFLPGDNTLFELAKRREVA